MLDHDSGQNESAYGYTIRGLTALGPPPIEAYDLRCEAGVDVLYGRNGSGKTRLMRGLACAAGSPYYAGDGSFLAHLQYGLGGDESLAVSVRFLLREMGPTTTGGDPVGARARRSGGGADYPWETPETDELLRLVARRLHRTLAGLHADPRWHVDDPAWLSRLVWELVEPGHLVVDSVAPQRFIALVAAPQAHATGLVVELLDSFRAELAADWPLDHNDGPSTIDDPRIAALWEGFLDYEGNPNPERLFGHAWAAVPLFNIGLFLVGRGPSSYGQSIMPIVEEDSDTDLDEATVQLWRDRRERMAISDPNAFRAMRGTVSPVQDRFFKSVDTAPYVSEQALTLAHELTLSANTITSTLLIDAPVLSLRPKAPDEWIEGGSPWRWVAKDPSGVDVPIEDLSQAQRRWSRIAVALALRMHAGEQFNAVLGLIVLDEPEAALHPTAQRFLATGLEMLASRFDWQILVATHSPALLRRADFRLHHVTRGARGVVNVAPLPSAFARDLPALGLDPPDLIQLTRVFVVVEGRHDEVIISQSLTEELESSAAYVIAMRGASNLSAVVDARFLFDFTDATVIVVLDNIGESSAVEIWKEAVSLYKDAKIEAAREVLETKLDRKSDEQRFLQEFGIRALEFGRADRLEVVGLSVPDVLDLLPVLALSPAAAGKTWVELRAEAGAKGTRSGSFKKWMAEKYGFDSTDETLIAAVDQLREIPSDLYALANAISTASNRSSMQAL